MASTDLNTNRLDNAIEQARLIISNLPQDARSTIITAGEYTQVLISSSQDRRLLYQTLDNINPETGTSDMTSALELASAITARQPDTEIIIFSDGKVNLPDQIRVQGKVRYIPIGNNGDNQAVSHITLENKNNNYSTAFVQVNNYAPEPVPRRLILKADGIIIDAHDLDIPAHGQVSIISEIIPENTLILEAALTGKDSLSLDDKIWAIQPVYGSHNVILVSEGNRFLETTLDLLPGINYSTYNLEEFESRLEGNNLEEKSALIIFDNHTYPVSSKLTHNLFYIGPITSTNEFSITGSIENPIPRPNYDNDPLLAYVDLKSVSILDAHRIPLPDWTRPVLIDEISGEPLLFVGERAGQRLAVMSFNPQRSDLPLQVAYPILMANLMEWLLPGRIGDIPAQVKPGQALNFTPPPEITSLTCTDPEGLTTQIDIQDGRAIYADTTKLGTYQVKWGKNQTLVFAVNFSDPQESDILPVEKLSVLDDLSTRDEGSPNQSRSEWWRSLLGIALIILIIEWMVYHRVTFLKIRSQINQPVKSDQ
jgi:hypothetical protein